MTNEAQQVVVFKFALVARLGWMLEGGKAYSEQHIAQTIFLYVCTTLKNIVKVLILKLSESVVPEAAPTQHNSNNDITFVPLMLVLFLKHLKHFNVTYPGRKLTQSMKREE